MMRFLLGTLLWMQLAIGALANPAPARIAVISDADNKDLAALITTELSSNQQVTLVERNDFAKIGDELKLQQLAGSDSVALGKLVRADGLLFLDKIPSGIEVRFTAVGLGYALFDDQITADQNPFQMAKSITHRLTGYASKLKLDPTKAIPISVLNLRADYGTPQSLSVERNLTLLLESKLTSVPEYVVLERRHAWSLGFEHSLDPAAKPLLRGAYLIDGTLSISSRTSDDCKVALRIRVPNGSESTTSFQGTVKDLPALADHLLAGVQKKLGGTLPVPGSSTTQEADEYLREALWGWRSRAPEAALEAVDSAELLGGNEADVVGLRVQSIVELCDQGMEDWYPFFDDPDTLPTFDPAELSERTDLILRALHDTARYRADKLESKLDALKSIGPWEVGNFRTGTLEADVTNVASKLLVILDQRQSPRADELRQTLRLVTGYDPLNGNPGKRMPATYNNTISRLLFADDWAQSLDEELAFYRLLCTDKEQVLPTAVIRDPQKRFCVRFLLTPEARQQGFDNFVESLKSNPDSRRTYLVLKTHSADPAAADTAYRNYLDELWEMRDQLVQSNSYTPAIESSYDVNEQVAARNGAAGLLLLHLLLTTDKPGSCTLPLFKMLVQPGSFSAENVATLWPELQAYRKHWTDAAWKQYGHPDDSFDAGMDQLVAPLIQKFPTICVVVAPAAASVQDSLEVTKFWHPWTLPDTPNDHFIIQSHEVGPDGLWLGGLFTDGALYHIDLTTFAAERVSTPDKKTPMELKLVDDHIYMTYFPVADPKRRYLARYEMKSATWESRPLPQLDWLRPYEACGQLYFFVTVKGPHEETALVRYDWDHDKWIELADNRRRPARNQYDDTEPLIDIGGIFTGPQHRPCVTLQEGTFNMKEKEGAWAPVFDDSWNSRLVRVGNRTLVMNFDGEVTMLDAAASGPEYWVANPTPHLRHFNQPGKPNPLVPTPWAAQARWNVPSTKTSNWRFQAAFHGDNLYILDAPRDANRCEVICYVKGNQTPRYIPLSFHLDDTTRAAISSPNIRLFAWAPGRLEHPETPDSDSSMAFQVVATNQGICLVYTTNGFWFLPYSDIEAYLKSHAPETSASPPPTITKASSPKHSSGAGDDDYDPGNPTSFR
jgi:hypothetical protein